MLPALATAIDELEIALDGDELAAAFALRDRVDARLATVVSSFDAADMWELDGATSMTAWLADRAGMTRPRAAATARHARLVARLPLTAAAWADGRLSSGQVEAICANLNTDLVDLFAAHEAAVLPQLVPLSAADVAVAMRTWRTHAQDTPPTPGRRQTLHASRLPDQDLAVKGTLDTETGELLLTALRLATSPDLDGEAVRSPATRRADALGDICRFFLDHQTSRPGGRHRPHINLVYDLDRNGDLLAAHTIGGSPIDGITAGRLLCDSIVHRVITRGRSAILDYGHATRASPHRCGACCFCATSTAASPVATAPANGARATMSGSGSTAAPPGYPTSCCSVAATTTCSTGPTGTPHPSPTAPSKSPTPAAASEPPAHPPPAHPKWHYASLPEQHSGRQAASAGLAVAAL